MPDEITLTPEDDALLTMARRLVGLKVLVVGGGAAGALVALQLRRQGLSEVTVADPAPQLGFGVAYSTTDPNHLLNVPAGKMSAYPDLPDHFLEHVGDGQAGAFVPRGAYGRYLAGELEKVGGVKHLRSLITSIDQTQDYDHVVLALGNAPPRLPAPLVGIAEHVIASPWGPTALDDVEPTDDVLIVGTGLTFADVVVTLANRGHTGRIVGLSKLGLLPAAHAPSQPVTLPPLPGSEIPAWVTHHARSAGENWRGFVDALRPHTVALWQKMSWVERGRFMRRLAGFWDVHRHRMPPQQAQRLAQLQGQLSIRKGWLPAVSAGQRLTVHFPAGDQEFDRIINCTGPDSDWRRLKVPVVESCVAAGIAEYDPLGMGLMVDYDGRVGDSGRLWAIGTLCRGCRWETTAIPELRVQAQRLAECVLKSSNR